jgi:hypothetical protein
VFDTDGVLTDTARVHAAAWKRLFDEYLERRTARLGGPFRAFEETDYLRYVDGRPRYDGVAGFLASRGIELPWGDPSDPPDRETVCGLGNAKDRSFVAHLRAHGAHAFPTSVVFVRRRGRRWSRTPWPGWTPDTAAGSGWWSGWTGVARRPPWPSAVPTWSWPTWGSSPSNLPWPEEAAGEPLGAGLRRLRPVG